MNVSEKNLILLFVVLFSLVLRDFEFEYVIFVVFVFKLVICDKNLFF